MLYDGTIVEFEFQDGTYADAFPDEAVWTATGWRRAQDVTPGMGIVSGKDAGKIIRAVRVYNYIGLMSVSVEEKISSLLL